MESEAGRKFKQIVQVPAARPSLLADEEAWFLRLHDSWIVRYQGDTALFKHMRGMYYLAALLRAPRQEFYVRDLLAATRCASDVISANAPHGNLRATFSDGIAALDSQAKAEFRRRIGDLREALEEAERFNDPHRRVALQSELQAISEHLATAVGLGGRDRKSSSDAERARSAITKCIKRAIQIIGKPIPVLGYHLATRIRTGYFCSYNPHPDRPLAWKTEYS
jgi:hypothetical protein